MPLYLVTVSRIVRDVVEGSIEIEAPDAATAEVKAMAEWHEGNLDLDYKCPAWDDVPDEEPEATAREVTPAEAPRAVTLTTAEITFLNRALPYIEQGMTMEDALRAVLARDQEIASISTAKTRTGEAIQRGLAAQVYHAARGQKAMERAVDTAADCNLNWR